MPNFDPDIDYYEILQVHPRAHQEVIKRAYRTILKLLQAHPDLGGSHEDAVRVNEAYQILSKPEVRGAYDAARHERGMATARATAYRQARAPYPPSAQRGQASPAGSDPATARTTRPGTRPVHWTVYCPHCGARNRLPITVTLDRAICGKCHHPLGAERRAPDEPHLPVGELQLTPALLDRLAGNGELRLHRAHLPVDRRLRCLRCGAEWVAGSDSLPETCPKCSSARWSDFRVFYCRFCRHQFLTVNLRAWPYWLFGDCPSCHKTHWHAGCENHPLWRILNRIGKMC